MLKCPLTLELRRYGEHTDSAFIGVSYSGHSALHFLRLYGYGHPRISVKIRKLILMKERELNLMAALEQIGTSIYTKILLGLLCTIYL